MKNKITGSPRRLQLNNAGVSFVELVVALLILAVIIVPLMGLFTSAASANRVNLIRSDADTLSQNIMEAVKAYGFAGTQNQFKKFSDGDSVICLGMEPATVAGGATGEANVYEYEMKNVPEGSHSYDVKIKLDSSDTAYTSANYNKDYNFNALNDPNIVIINPLSSKYFDQDVLSQVVRKNQIMVQQVEQRVQNYLNADPANAATLKPEYDSTNVGGYCLASFPFYDLVYGDAYRYGGEVMREMHLIISEETEVVGGVSTDYYQVRSNMDYLIPAFLVDPDYHAYVAGESPADTDPYVINSGDYCDIRLENLNAIYILYTPYPYMSKSAFWPETDSLGNIIDIADPDPDDPTGDPAVPTEDPGYTFYRFTLGKLKEYNNMSFKREKLIIDNNTDLDDLEIYLVIQGNENATYSSTDLLTVEQTDRSNNFTVFCQADLRSTTINPVRIRDSVVKSEEKHRNKLMNVTVTVSEKDGTEVFRTMTSTIQQ